MFIRIERASSVPISRQIADQVRALCIARSLKPGERLPSVRELARELAVNQNTVLRVYDRLAAEGLLERRQGDGTFVADRPPTWRLNGQRKRLAEELRQVVRRGQMLGLDADALHQLLDDALAAQPQPDSLDTDPPPPSEGSRR